MTLYLQQTVFILTIPHSVCAKLTDASHSKDLCIFHCFVLQQGYLSGGWDSVLVCYGCQNLRCVCCRQIRLFRWAKQTRPLWILLMYVFSPSYKCVQRLLSISIYITQNRDTKLYIHMFLSLFCLVLCVPAVFLDLLQCRLCLYLHIFIILLLSLIVFSYFYSKCLCF